MSQFILTKGGALQPGMRRHTLSYHIRFGTVTIVFFLLGIFAVVVMMSMRHFITATTSGYYLRELEDRREQLTHEYEVNRMLVDRVRALSAVQQSEVVQRMVRPSAERISYIQDDMAVAVK